MLAYTVVHGRSENARTTLHVEGEVTASDWEKLRELSLFALKNSDRLTLNLEMISGYDYSLSIFVCLLRRTVQLQSKQLSVQGRQQEDFVCLYEAALESEKKWCSFTGAVNCCLEENLYAKSTLQTSMSREVAGRFGGDCKCDNGQWQGCQHGKDAEPV